jgi:putative NADH-flavin reductase
MKLTVFAATGGIGRLVVEQALAARHDVTAVARNTSRLPEKVRVVAADLAAPNPTELQATVEGAHAVISCLGPRPLSDAGVGITSRGTRAIIQAMQSAGTRRLVVVSAAPVGTVPSPGNPTPPKHDPGDGVLMRYLLGPIIKAILRKHYADLALMEDFLRDSGLDWTSVRPPRLTNGRLTGSYRTALGQNVRRGTSLSRADTAHLMLAVLSRPETIKRTVAAAY